MTEDAMIVVVVTSRWVNWGNEFPREFPSKKSDMTMRSNTFVQVGACIFPISDVSWTQHLYLSLICSLHSAQSSEETTVIPG